MSDQTNWQTPIKKQLCMLASTGKNQNINGTGFKLFYGQIIMVILRRAS